VPSSLHSSLLLAGDSTQVNFTSDITLIHLEWLLRLNPDADKWKCSGLMNGGHWVLSPHRESDGVSPAQWQPPGCLLYPYNASEIAYCTGDGKILFVGDSVVCQIFWPTAQMFLTPTSSSLVCSLLFSTDRFYAFDTILSHEAERLVSFASIFTLFDVSLSVLLWSFYLHSGLLLAARQTKQTTTGRCHMFPGYQCCLLPSY
jgi:hypothetical protein